MATNTGSTKKLIVVELKTTGQTKEIEKSIKKVVTDLRNYEDRLKEIKKRYQELSQKAATSWRASDVEKYEKSLKSLDKVFLRVKTNAESNRKAFNDYSKSIRENTGIMGQNKRAIEERKRAEAEAKRIQQEKTKAEKDAAKAAKEHQKAMQEAAKQEQQRKDDLSDLAEEVIAVAAAYQILKQTLSFLVESYITFEYTLMNVQTLLNDTDRSLKSGAIQVMKDYGFAIEDVNKALFDAISAMIPARSAINFLNEAARLAIGGVTDLKTAVDGLTSVINAYSLEVSEAGRVADAFFRAQKWGKTTVRELVDDIGRLAPVASIAGVSYQEMLSTLAELTLGGLDTRESVTVLRQAISGLIKPAAEAEKALRKYNVPVGIAEVSNAGLAYSLGKLMEAYGEFPDIVAEMIPNIRAFTGVTALTAQRLQHLAMITKDVNENWGEFSSLSEAFSKQMTTMEMRVRRFRAEVKALGIEYGEKLRPILKWALDNFKEIGTIVISLTASFISFTMVLKVIPFLFAQITKAASIATTAIGRATSGISLLVGAATALFLWKSKPKEGFVESFKNVDRQLEATTTAIGVLFDEAEDATKRMEELQKAGVVSGKEWEEALAAKRDALMELNTSYGEYIKNILNETAALEDLKKAREDANKQIINNIVLKNKTKGVEAATTRFEGKLEPEMADLYESISSSFKGSREELNMFLRDLYKFGDQYREEITKATEETGQLGKETERELKDKYFKKIFESFKKVFGDSKKAMYGYAGIKDALDAILVITKDYGVELGQILYDLKEYQDILDQEKKNKPESIREYPPASIMGVPAMDFGKESLTYAQYMLAIENLPEDFDEYKKELMIEYARMYKELNDFINDPNNIDTITGLPYKSLSQEQRRLNPILTEMENAVIQQANKVATALADPFIAEIDAYNFYTKSALDYTEKLTDAQRKDLALAIIKWNQAMEKEQLAHNRRMLNMHLSYVEEENNAYDEGYQKELVALQLNYARKMLQLELALDTQREQTKMFIENMQLEKRPEELAIINEELVEYEKQNAELIDQAHQVYVYQHERMLIKIAKDLEKFRTQYEKEGDVIAELTQNLKDTFESMIKSYSDLMIGEEGLAIKPLLQKLQDEGIEFDLNSVITDEMLAGLDERQLAKFIELFRELQKIISKFQEDTPLKTLETKTNLLESLGILGIDNAQLLETAQLLDLIKDNVNNLTDAEINLAKAVLEVNQAEEKFNTRKNIGVATYGEEYDIRYKRLEVQLELKDITQEEFDKAVSTLNREIPKWMRKISYQALDDIKNYGYQALDIAVNTLNQVMQMQADAANRQYQRDMDMMQDKHDTELDLLKERLDKQLISEEIYEREKEKIDSKYRRREEELKRRQFEQDKKRAVAQAIIQGAVATIKAYIDGGWINAALVAAETIAQVAVIEAQKYAKGGIIGGNKHSEGGTKFFGTDGSAFEAERGELLAVVNANDTATLKALSKINSIHGNSFFKDGGIVDGGLFQRDILNSLNNNITVDDLINAFESVPPPTLLIEEFNRKNQRLTEIKDAARV